MAFHPLNHFVIQSFRYQHGYTKFRKQSFQCPFPFLFTGFDFHDFSRKRHIPFRHHQILAQFLADRNKLFRNVGISFLQRFQFRPVIRNLGYQVTFPTIGFKFFLIQVIEIFPELVHHIFQCFSLFHKSIQVTW